MSDFISSFAHLMESMLAYREALGFARVSHISSLNSFDRFCAGLYPDANALTEEIVLGWLGKHSSQKKRANIAEKATTVRLLGRYMEAMGETLKHQQQ